MPRSTRLQAIDVHRFGEHIFHHFAHQRMIGNLDFAFDVFLAGGHVGKYRSQQIVGAHALNLRRNFLAALKTQQGQGAVRIPAPARGEDRRIERGLLQNRLHGLGLQEMEHIAQRKAVLLGERDVQAVVGGRGLQFEIEADAEALAQSQSPGFVDAAAEGRVNDQLHAAAFVEKSLGDDRRLRGHGAQNRAALQNVFDRLLGAGIVEAAFFFQPGRLLAATSGCVAENPTGEVCGSISLIFSRNSPTCSDNSSVRAGASPRQNGTVGGAPCASSTSTRPEFVSTRRIRHDVLPSSMMSPRLLSTAKSSSTVPTTMPSGCATTVYRELSGIAPPLVMAASRAPRRARSCRSRGRDADTRRSARAAPQCLPTASRESIECLAR